MYLLISSGILYLIGISIVLMLRPTLMFSADGKWKEFGIGRSKDRYTWMPFWLFAIMWAIISYIIVLVIASHTQIGSNAEIVENQTSVEIANEVITPENVTTKSLQPTPIVTSKKKITTQNMKNGYYILNEEETMKKGIPKYIYLGPEAPNLVFHSNMMEEGEE
jgi:hypothetical protein